MYEVTFMKMNVFHNNQNMGFLEVLSYPCYNHQIITRNKHGCALAPSFPMMFRECGGCCAFGGVSPFTKLLDLRDISFDNNVTFRVSSRIASSSCAFRLE
jgi:hypothetical protein